MFVPKSRPIKETPVLYGTDAQKFLEDITNNETDMSKRISRKEYDRTKRLYVAMMKKANFT